LSKHSNILISGDAPSVYLKRIEDRHKITAEALDDILRTHLIDPQHLRNDDFQGFVATRTGSLVSLVATAMGKAVVEEHGSNEKEIEFEPSSMIVEDEEEYLGSYQELAPFL